MLGWTTETQKHTAVTLSESQKDEACCVAFQLVERFANERQNKHVGIQCKKDSQTHSPLSLLLRCLRYMAMAVPMMASSRMTPMMAPMMLPVVEPFSGRRVPG